MSAEDDRAEGDETTVRAAYLVATARCLEELQWSGEFFRQLLERRREMDGAWRRSLEPFLCSLRVKGYRRFDAAPNGKKVRVLEEQLRQSPPLAGFFVAAWASLRPEQLEECRTFLGEREDWRTLDPDALATWCIEQARASNLLPGEPRPAVALMLVNAAASTPNADDGDDDEPGDEVDDVVAPGDEALGAAEILDWLAAIPPVAPLWDEVERLVDGVRVLAAAKRDARGVMARRAAISEALHTLCATAKGAGDLFGETALAALKVDALADEHLEAARGLMDDLRGVIAEHRELEAKALPSAISERRVARQRLSDLEETIQKKLTALGTLFGDDEGGPSVQAGPAAEDNPDGSTGGEAPESATAALESGAGPGDAGDVVAPGSADDALVPSAEAVDGGLAPGSPSGFGDPRPAAATTDVDDAGSRTDRASAPATVSDEEVGPLTDEDGVEASPRPLAEDASEGGGPAAAALVEASGDAPAPPHPRPSPETVVDRALTDRSTEALAQLGELQREWLCDGANLRGLAAGLVLERERPERVNFISPGLCWLACAVGDVCAHHVEVEPAEFSLLCARLSQATSEQQRFFVGWVSAGLLSAIAQRSVAIVSQVSEPGWYGDWVDESPVFRYCVDVLVEPARRGHAPRVEDVEPLDRVALRRDKALAAAEELVKLANNYQNAYVKRWYMQLVGPGGPVRALLEEARAGKFPTSWSKAEEIAGQVEGWERVVATYRHNIVNRLTNFIDALRVAKLATQEIAGREQPKNGVLDSQQAVLILPDLEELVARLAGRRAPSTAAFRTLHSRMSSLFGGRR